MRRNVSAHLLAVSLMALPLGASAANLTAAAGATGQGGTTLRIGLEQAWGTRWFESDTGHFTGYWDAGYTWWESGRRASATHSLSFAPVLVYQFNGQRFQPFIELGIGVSLFSRSRVGDRTLGSALNFEDRIGVGIRLNRNHVVGLRAMHYSNAGLVNPNDGVESYAIYYSGRF